MPERCSSRALRSSRSWTMRVFEFRAAVASGDFGKVKRRRTGHRHGRCAARLHDRGSGRPHRAAGRHAQPVVRSHHPRSRPGASWCPACSPAPRSACATCRAASTVPPAALVRDGADPTQGAGVRDCRRQGRAARRDGRRRGAGRRAGDERSAGRRSRRRRSAGVARPGHAGGGPSRGARRGHSHVSQRPVHQAAGLRHHDDGGAGRARPDVVSRAEGRSVSRRRVPGRHRHDALRGRVAGDRRARRHEEDRRGGQHRRGRPPHRVDLAGRPLEHRRPVQHRRADAERVAGHPRQGGGDSRRAAARNRRADHPAHRSQRRAHRVGGRQRADADVASRVRHRRQAGQAAARERRRASARSTSSARPSARFRSWSIEDRLEAYGLSLAQVVDALGRRTSTRRSARPIAARPRRWCAWRRRARRPPTSRRFPSSAWRPHAARARRRAGGRRRRRGAQPRVRERPPGDRARRAEAGRRQHGRRRRRCPRGGRRDGARAAARRVAAGGSRRFDVHPRIDRGRAGHARARRPADRLHRVPVPQLVALDRHHRADAADLGHRRVHRDAAVRLHAERADADGPVAGHRHADRRRDRRAREHRPAHAARQGSPRSGARRHGGDRPRGHGHDVHDHRRVHPGRLHGRHGRAVLLPVRHHRDRGRARVAVRQLHARPDAVVALVRPRRRGAPPPRADRPRAAALQQGGSTTCTPSTSGRSTGRCGTAGSCWLSPSSPSSARSRSSRCSAATSCPTSTAASIRSSFKATPGATLRETGERAQQMVGRLRAASRRRLHLHDDRRGRLRVPSR